VCLSQIIFLLIRKRIKAGQSTTGSRRAFHLRVAAPLVPTRLSPPTKRRVYSAPEASHLAPRGRHFPPHRAQFRLTVPPPPPPPTALAMRDRPFPPTLWQARLRCVTTIASGLFP